jgi:hypothetical protein
MTLKVSVKDSHILDITPCTRKNLLPPTSREMTRYVVLMGISEDDNVQAIDQFYQ